MSCRRPIISKTASIAYNAYANGCSFASSSAIAQIRSLSSSFPLFFGAQYPRARACKIASLGELGAVVDNSTGLEAHFSQTPHDRALFSDGHRHCLMTAPHLLHRSIKCDICASSVYRLVNYGIPTGYATGDSCRIFATISVMRPYGATQRELKSSSSSASAAISSLAVLGAVE